MLSICFQGYELKAYITALKYPIAFSIVVDLSCQLQFKAVDDRRGMQKGHELGSNSVDRLMFAQPHSMSQSGEVSTKVEEDETYSAVPEVHSKQNDHNNGLSNTN